MIPLSPLGNTFSLTHRNLMNSSTKRVLILLANPTTASTTGWPVGFWASELSHPYLEFVASGYDVTIASVSGGKVVPDAMSDPRDESEYSAHDFVSRGFFETPALNALLEATPALSSLDPGDFDAFLIAGGQAPMFSFRTNSELQAWIRTFYESGKPTAALCHGVCAFLDVELSDGTRLITDRTITGFSNQEEDAVNEMVGQEVMPFRIETLAREFGANFTSKGAWQSFAIRDGNLITGQQQNSGRETAHLIIEALGR